MTCFLPNLPDLKKKAKSKKNKKVEERTPEEEEELEKQKVGVNDVLLKGLFYTNGMNLILLLVFRTLHITFCEKMS
jgi:hypothetical protein